MTNTKKKKKKKLKSKYLKILFNLTIAILIVLFLISTYKGLSILYFDNKNKKDNDKLIKEVIKIKEDKDDDVNLDDEDNKEEYEIDFWKLKERNSDVVGWIMIPNTNINYPIVKASDNDYYLTRNIDKKYNRNGMIFMNYKNSSDFSDNNTTLFGHNTYNKTMFGELKNIYNKELGDEVDIYIYTISGTYRYRVYSAYIAEPYDPKPLYATTKFFEETSKKFKYDKTNLETLTLSTCHTDRTKRLIIHALKQEKIA